MGVSETRITLDKGGVLRKQGRSQHGHRSFLDDLPQNYRFAQAVREQGGELQVRFRFQLCSHLHSG